MRREGVADKGVRCLHGQQRGGLSRHFHIASSREAAIRRAENCLEALADAKLKNEVNFCLVAVPA